MKLINPMIVIVSAAILIVGCGSGSNEESKTGDTGGDNEETVDNSTEGMLTDAEVSSLLNMLKTSSAFNVPAAPVYGNAWVYGNIGNGADICGKMFETTFRKSFLDRLIEYDDASYYTMNCQPGGDHRVIGWLGTVEDIFPSTIQDDGTINAAVEEGAIMGHFAYCARLILQVPYLWDKEVSVGDPHGYGATYKERAMTYIDLCDRMYDSWLSRFVNPSDKVFYRRDSIQLIEPIPWNQALMGCEGLSYMAECHDLLGNNDRAELYDDIVAGNVKYFMEDSWTIKSSLGTTCLQWRYHKNADRTRHAEDLGHGAYDSKVFNLLYHSGRQKLVDRSFMTLFANTMFDIVYSTKNAEGRFPWRINGAYVEGKGDNYVRANYLPLTLFRDDWYDKVLTINGRRVSTSVDMLGNHLWCKARRQDAPKNISVSVSGNDVTLNWTPVNSGRVWVQSSSDLESWKNVGVTYASKGTYTDKDLTAAGDVFYRLVYLDDKKAGYSSLISVQI